MCVENHTTKCNLHYTTEYKGYRNGLGLKLNENVVNDFNSRKYDELCTLFEIIASFYLLNKCSFWNIFYLDGFVINPRTTLAKSKLWNNLHALKLF